MPRLALITEFDGTSFSGFQSQKNGRAVQDVLETALGTLFKENIRLTGCSRTDAGVHARCHLSHADVPFVIPEENIPLAMNAILDDDVAVIIGRLVYDRVLFIRKQQDAVSHGEPFKVPICFFPKTLQAYLEKLPYYDRLNDAEKNQVLSAANTRIYRKGDILPGINYLD